MGLDPEAGDSERGTTDAVTDDRISLGILPTPLEPLTRLSEYLAGPRIWVKRDDCTGLAGGGNKVRKLEFLLADARRSNADVVLTAGAVQSNHARLTAAACARLGIRCELWLNRAVPGRGKSYERSGNVLIDRLADARVQLLPRETDAEAAAMARARELRTSGARPYVIPVGGSNPIGARGYVEAGHELMAQARQAGVSMRTVIAPAASGGTLAGLSVGLAREHWKGRLVGMAVGAAASAAAATVRRLAKQTARRFDLGDPIDVEVFDLCLGRGYGIPTRECLEAIKLLARLEGLLLDPVYSGKAMAGLIAMATAGSFSGDVVFLHTGGWPTLFGYEEDLGCDWAR